jgi:hypothetical protein
MKAFIAFFASDVSSISPELSGLLDELMAEKYLLETEFDPTIRILAMHPLFDIKTDYGQIVIQKTQRPPPKPKQTLWDDIILKDIWMISESSYLVYDLDSNPGTHYLMAAILNEVPIVAVSQTLKGVPPYFSPFVEQVIKPCQVIKYLTKGRTLNDIRDTNRSDSESVP